MRQKIYLIAMIDWRVVELVCAYPGGTSKGEESNNGRSGEGVGNLYWITVDDGEESWWHAGFQRQLVQR